MTSRLCFLIAALAAVVLTTPALAAPPGEPVPDSVPDAVADPVPDSVPDAVPAPEPDEPAGDVHEPLRRHALRFGLGFQTPFGLGGLEISDRERIFRDGAVSGDSALQGSGLVSYRRGLLDVRLLFSGRILTLTEGTSVVVEDGVESHGLLYERGGGYFGLAAMAGVTWEPTLYSLAGSEGLALALTALGGHEHVSIWGSLRDERIPNYRHPEQSFHWIVERQRFDGEVALRWRHVVGGDTLLHYLGIEAGLNGSLYVHIPGISYASDAISGATSAWGSWMLFVRLTYEIGLPGGGAE